MKSIGEALDAAPQHPACFDNRMQWAEYLLHCQLHGKRSTVVPFDYELAFKPSFNFCNDCTQEYAAEMSAAGRCNPDVFRVPAKPEIA